VIGWLTRIAEPSARPHQLGHRIFGCELDGVEVALAEEGLPWKAIARRQVHLHASPSARAPMWSKGEGHSATVAADSERKIGDTGWPAQSPT